MTQNCIAFLTSEKLTFFNTYNSVNSFNYQNQSELFINMQIKPNFFFLTPKIDRKVFKLTCHYCKYNYLFD